MTREAGYLVAPKGKVPMYHCDTFKEAKIKAKSIAPAVIIEVGGPGIFGGYTAEVVQSVER